MVGLREDQRPSFLMVARKGAREKKERDRSGERK